MQPLLVVFLIIGINLLKSQTILDSISDTTLTVSNSPYIVNNWITFSGHITIENGVQIKFMDAFFITLTGSLNCGCSNPSLQNNNIKGLSNTTTYIHFIGDASAPKSIGLFINHGSNIPNTPPTIQFCNTLFENTINGIVTNSLAKQYGPYTVYNCEFKSVNNAIKHSTAVTNTIYNSYFHNVNSIYEVGNANTIGGVVFDNCLFHSFREFSQETAKSVNIAIRNSEIYGDHNQVCINIDSITGDSKYAIYNNIISNCVDGIEILSADISVRNNTITNCSRYGIYAYDTLGYFDIKYNTFGNNGIYDIMINNVQNVEIVNNIFMTNYKHNATVYAMDIDNININNNNFMSLKHDSILLFNYVDHIYISDNNFIENTNKQTLLWANNSENVSISNNNFIGNIGKYLFHLTNGNGLYINDNNISNNTMVKDVIYVNYINDIQINSNAMINNELTQIISVQNANHNHITNNIIHNNYVNINTISNALILSQMTNNIYIKSNQFNNNGITKSNTNFMLIYFNNTSQISIKYNTFKNSIHTANILHFNYLDDIDRAYISHNNFIQNIYNITSYINVNAGSVYFKPKIFISVNNFYNISKINYFISTNDVYINGNNNFYSGLKSYNIISQYIEPNKPCQINISHAIEQPLTDDTTNYNKCSWQFVDSNCNTGEMTNTHCDSDTTYNPTYNPSSIPTISPTISPTIATISASIKPTTNTNIKPSLRMTPKPSTISSTIQEGQLVTTTLIEGNVTHPSYNPNRYIKGTNDGSFMIIAGSAGITLVFLIFAAILLYVFLKLSKLKKETAHLNKQIGKNNTIDIDGNMDRKSIGLDSIGNEIYAIGKPNDDELDMVINAMNINSLNSRKSSKLSVMSAAQYQNDIRKKSSLLTIASLQNNRKKSSLKSDGYVQSLTPRPPPRKSHTYQPRFVEKGKMLSHQMQMQMAMEEEKDAIETDRDNSSAMYMNYSHNPIIEIEGNETREYRMESLDSDEYNDNMIMNAINTSMPNIGELSVTAKHSFSKTLVKTPGLYNQKSNSNLHNNLQSHKKSNSNFGHNYKKSNSNFNLLKIDIPISDIKVNRNNDDELGLHIDDNETQLSELLSEEETSESSRSFTIPSQEEHKGNITLEVAQNIHKNSINSNENINMKNINVNGYCGLTSPTDTTMNVNTPSTPQMPQSPAMDPDEILHSLEFRHKMIKQKQKQQQLQQQQLQQQQQQQPGTPQGSAKLPKPKTKGHWM